MATPRCTACSKTTGKRCEYFAIPGGSVCIVHGGASPSGAAPDVIEAEFSGENDEGDITAK